MNRHGMTSTASLLTLLACAVATGVHAQTAEAGGANSTQLGEVVVTAQRRSENLQKVPEMVDAVSSKQLQDRVVSSLLDLQKLSPALTVQDTASNVSPFIRGVGTTVTGAGQSASVATYIDGVYIATLASGAFDLNNVDQVEVLAGPQGALYGRNATGGAIVVTTHTPHPGDAFAGDASVQLGNYSSRYFSGSASGGLGNGFAVYVAASSRDHDGYIKNLNPPGLGAEHDDLNDRHAWSVQGALTYQPNDQLELVLRGSHFESLDRFGVGLQAVGLDIPVQGALNGSQTYYAGVLQGFGFSPAQAAAAAGALRFSPKFGQSYDNEFNGFQRGILGGPFLPGSFTDVNTDSGSLKATYRFDAFQISSLTSYTAAQSKSATEIILANPATYPTGFQNGDVGFSGDFPSHNLQEDLEITSIKGRINWIAGMFYYDGIGRTDLTADLPNFSARTALNTWRNISTAGYGQVTVPIIDHISITVGGRYTSEIYHVDDEIQPTTPFNLLGTPNTGIRELNASQATYTARLQYDLGDLLAYAGVATGFKAGSFSVVNLASPGVKPETITSYEGGVKWDPNNATRLNLSIYHYDYNNIQIAFTDSATGSNIFVNGTGAQLTGADFQALERATDWLTLRADGMVLDSSYNSNVPVAGSTFILPTKGKRLAGAPNYSFSVGGDVLITPVTRGDLKLSIDVLRNGGYWFDAANMIGTGGANAAGYTTLDLHLSYRPHGQRWEVSVFATNATDEKYYSSGLSASLILRSALAADPALYGVGFSTKF